MDAVFPAAQDVGEDVVVPIDLLSPIRIEGVLVFVVQFLPRFLQFVVVEEPGSRGVVLEDFKAILDAFLRPHQAKTIVALFLFHQKESWLTMVCFW